MQQESFSENATSLSVPGSPTSPRRRYPVLSVDVGETKGANTPTRRHLDPLSAQQHDVQHSPSLLQEQNSLQQGSTATSQTNASLSATDRVPAPVRAPNRLPRQAPELPRSPSGSRRSSNKPLSHVNDDHTTGSPDAERIKAFKSPERIHSMLQPKSGKAEVHIIGEIVGCTGCQQRSVSCRWYLDYDEERWQVVKGLDKGCTQMSTPNLPEDPLTLWSHPVDIWMSTHSIQRWPSLVFKLYTSDDCYGYGSFCGHAVCPLPTTSGIHEISCRAWFALDSSEPASERVWRWFAGRTPRLVDESYVVDGHGRREGQNSLLYTEPAGTIHLRLHVLFKDLVDLVHVGGESLLQSLEKLHTSAEKSRRRARSTVQAMQEHSAEISEGLRSVQQGREARFQAVQQALDARRTTDQQSPPLSRHSSHLSSESRWSNRGHTSDTPSAGGYTSSAATGRPSMGTSRAGSRRGTNSDAETTPGADPSRTASTSRVEAQSPSPTRRNLRERASPISSRITSSPSASRPWSRSAAHDQEDVQTPTRAISDSPTSQYSGASGRYHEPDYGPL